jgi:polysaccharide biosynthesis/export protein
LLRKLFFLVLTTLIAAGCTSSATYSYSNYAKEPDPRKHPYRIGVADSLSIQVWKDRELSTEVRVRPDGTVTMPLIGEVEAAGRTPTELRDEIKRRLERYVRDAIVTVSVSEPASYRFTVAGAVRAPGIYSPAYYVTVSEAIALAGGPDQFANADEVVLIRGGQGGKKRRIPIDYDAILEGDQPEQDIAILPGDTVYVP